MRQKSAHASSTQSFNFIFTPGSTYNALEGTIDKLLAGSKYQELESTYQSGVWRQPRSAVQANIKVQTDDKHAREPKRSHTVAISQVPLHDQGACIAQDCGTLLLNSALEEPERCLVLAGLPSDVSLDEVTALFQDKCEMLRLEDCLEQCLTWDPAWRIARFCTDSGTRRGLQHSRGAQIRGHTLRFKLLDEILAGPAGGGAASLLDGGTCPTEPRQGVSGEPAGGTLEPLSAASEGGTVPALSGDLEDAMEARVADEAMGEVEAERAQPPGEHLLRSPHPEPREGEDAEGDEEGAPAALGIMTELTESLSGSEATDGEQGGASTKEYAVARRARRAERGRRSSGAEEAGRGRGRDDTKPVPEDHKPKGSIFDEWQREEEEAAERGEKEGAVERGEKEGAAGVVPPPKPVPKDHRPKGSIFDEWQREEEEEAERKLAAPKEKKPRGSIFDEWQREEEEAAERKARGGHVRAAAGANPRGSRDDRDARTRRPWSREDSERPRHKPGSAGQIREPERRRRGRSRDDAERLRREGSRLDRPGDGARARGWSRDGSERRRRERENNRRQDEPPPPPRVRGGEAGQPRHSPSASSHVMLKGTPTAMEALEDGAPDAQMEDPAAVRGAAGGATEACSPDRSPCSAGDMVGSPPKSPKCVTPFQAPRVAGAAAGDALPLTPGCPDPPGDEARRAGIVNAAQTAPAPPPPASGILAGLGRAPLVGIPTICIDFWHGRCNNGDSCQWSHASKPKNFATIPPNPYSRRASSPSLAVVQQDPVGARDTHASTSVPAQVPLGGGVGRGEGGSSGSPRKRKAAELAVEAPDEKGGGGVAWAAKWQADPSVQRFRTPQAGEERICAHCQLPGHSAVDCTEVSPGPAAERPGSDSRHSGGSSSGRPSAPGRSSGGGGGGVHKDRGRNRGAEDAGSRPRGGDGAGRGGSERGQSRDIQGGEGLDKWGNAGHGGPGAGSGREGSGKAAAVSTATASVEKLYLTRANLLTLLERCADVKDLDRLVEGMYVRTRTPKAAKEIRNKYCLGRVLSVYKRDDAVGKHTGYHIQFKSGGEHLGTLLDYVSNDPHIHPEEMQACLTNGEELSEREVAEKTIFRVNTLDPIMEGNASKAVVSPSPSA
ncbi:hypothetical protein CYMTET_46793 [Cymbomonas tetramitiformis]|uniref:C3H1-type domain-containing protein n=1 Tax=Cymbomonas tetramitiformis TaxID=36881 RepID=A0AAE0BXD3_9CHLO|nr:hypothetical protein CYMTET_46793 [Cymbomonas tetramitiformis]